MMMSSTHAVLDGVGQRRATAASAVGRWPSARVRRRLVVGASALGVDEVAAWARAAPRMPSAASGGATCSRRRRPTLRVVGDDRGERAGHVGDPLPRGPTSSPVAPAARRPGAARGRGSSAATPATRGGVMWTRWPSSSRIARPPSAEPPSSSRVELCACLRPKAMPCVPSATCLLSGASVRDDGQDVEAELRGDVVGDADRAVERRGQRRPRPRRQQDAEHAEHDDASGWRFLSRASGATGSSGGSRMRSRWATTVAAVSVCSFAGSSGVRPASYCDSARSRSAWRR